MRIEEYNSTLCGDRSRCCCLTIPQSAFRNPQFEMITYSFSGKVVLVTGSSRGIGAGVLSAFAKAGATCVLHFWDDPDGGNRKDADALAVTLRGLPSKPAVHVLAADVRDAGQA